MSSERSRAIFDVVQVLLRDHRVPYDLVEKVRAMMSEPVEMSGSNEHKVYPSAEELMG